MLFCFRSARRITRSVLAVTARFFVAGHMTCAEGLALRWSPSDRRYGTAYGPSKSKVTILHRKNNEMTFTDPSPRQAQRNWRHYVVAWLRVGSHSVIPGAYPRAHLTCGSARCAVDPAPRSLSEPGDVPLESGLPDGPPEHIELARLGANGQVGRCQQEQRRHHHGTEPPRGDPADQAAGSAPQ